MPRTVAIGIQDFEKIRNGNYFYIDKTSFIKEWWEGGDDVTLIARPRRFGKTLNMSMLEQFFSINYAGRKDLFEGLSIWGEEKYRQMQGTYPVISLSFANIKEQEYSIVKEKMHHILRNLYNKHLFLKKRLILTLFLPQFNLQSKAKNILVILTARLLMTMVFFILLFAMVWEDMPTAALPQE